MDMSACQVLFSRADTRDAMAAGFTGWTPPDAETVVNDIPQCSRFTNLCGPFISRSYAQRMASPWLDKASPHNVVLMLFADGVNGTRHSDYSMFVISCMVINLPREQRRLRQNILPLMIVPGPRPPKDMTAFLQPLIDELGDLWRDGVNVQMDHADPPAELLVRAMLFAIVADSRAHPKLTMMMQSPSKYPCHLCDIQVSAYARTMCMPCRAIVDAASC